MRILLISLMFAACGPKNPVPAAAGEAPMESEEAAAGSAAQAGADAFAGVAWDQRATTTDDLDDGWRGVWQMEGSISHWTFVTDGRNWSLTAVDTGDGETFELAELGSADGRTVSFKSRMPSTDHTLQQTWTMGPDGNVTAVLVGDANVTLPVSKILDP